MVESRLTVEERLEAIEDALEALLGTDPPAAICNEPPAVVRTPIYDGEAICNDAKTPLPGGIRMVSEGGTPRGEGYATSRHEGGVMTPDEKLDRILSSMDNFERRLSALEARSVPTPTNRTIDRVVGTATVLASSFLEGAIRGAGAYAGSALAMKVEAQFAPPPPPPPPSLWAIGGAAVAATAATAAVAEVTKMGVRSLFET